MYSAAARDDIKLPAPTHFAYQLREIIEQASSCSTLPCVAVGGSSPCFPSTQQEHTAVGSVQFCRSLHGISLH